MQIIHANAKRLVMGVVLLAAVDGCDDRKKPTASIVPSVPTVPATAPAKVQMPGIASEQFAVPHVTIIETAEGTALRVKLKESLASFEMVKVPGGMVELSVPGPDGKPQEGKTQAVQVKPFWMSKTELPWQVYDTWVLRRDLSEAEASRLKQNEGLLEKRKAAWSRPTNPHEAPDGNFGHEGYPTNSIHPHAAEMFCKWLSGITGQTYRLPTEAEWVHACRGGSVPVTLSKADAGRVAWFIGNSENPETVQLTSHPIGTKPANAFGLHDMLGNVAEWTRGADGQFVYKGGSFQDNVPQLNCLDRTPYNEGILQMRNPQDPKSAWWLTDGFHVGFRVVREE